MRAVHAGLSALLLAGCATTARNAPPPAPVAVPPGMQYLYGSGEAAALSIQSYRDLVAWAGERKASRPRDSVVLAPGATLDSPKFVACGAKPLAVVFDVDETLLLNLGFEERESHRPGGGFDETAWARWERTGAGAVQAVPGAKFAVDTLRDRLGIRVIFNTNRSAANAAGTIAALRAAGLGEAVHGETLFLAGDDATGARKDGRRWRIAARYCVIAMAGDQLGDFSDLFNAGGSVPERRLAVSRATAIPMWGAGWFVLPNPVYGTALRGATDDVFPRDRRWADDAPTGAK